MANRILTLERLADMGVQEARVELECLYERDPEAFEIAAEQGEDRLQAERWIREARHE